MANTLKQRTDVCARARALIRLPRKLTLYTAGGGEASPVGTAMVALTVRPPRLEVAFVTVFLSITFFPTFPTRNAEDEEEDARAGDANTEALRTDTRRHVACTRAGCAMEEMAAMITFAQ